MNQAQQLERSKHTPKTTAGDSARSKKRKAPEVVVQASSKCEEAGIKRLKTTKPNVSDTLRYANDTCASKKKIEAPTRTTLSPKTMSKLNAFRFSAAQSKDCQMPLTKTDEEDNFQPQDDQIYEEVATKSGYVMKDNSSRLIQSGKKEMVKVQQAEHMVLDEDEISMRQATEDGDAIEQHSRYNMKDHSSRLIQAGIDAAQEGQASGAGTQDDDKDNLATALFTEYRMKNHASRLIETGKEKLAIPPNQVSPVFPKNNDELKAPDLKSAGLNDLVVDIDDFDDSIFDDPSLDEFTFEEATPTNTTGLTEMDDLDDSVFDEIIANDEARWNEAPSSAQPETNCISCDTASSPAKPGLMLPPKLPLPVSPPKAVLNICNGRKATPPDTPISPFLRPPASELLNSPSSIPSLHAAGRVATCFRLADMFREISSPTPPFAIELFAMVQASVRNRDKMSQSFTFADLFFPQRPPYVHGVYAKCAESELFSDDSRPFLKAGQGSEGILARAIVKQKVKTGKQLPWNQKHGLHASEEASAGMEVEVLGIYVSSWEEIDYTKGIVMPEKEMPIKKEGEQEVFYKSEKKRKFMPLKPLKMISSNLPSSPTRMTGTK